MDTQEMDSMFDLDPQITVMHGVAEGRNGRPAALSGTQTTASGSCGPTLCATAC